ncbi:EamA family transporter RarD [Desulfospira joergensenii]|uniref:EamA family transporter RarD n=1 Tax=Desulfospira joergensenii TaxID=53329 RepID=UPI0003B72416|nr:EamA family transporter RarD [Desulfospira joergensenii]
MGKNNRNKSLSGLISGTSAFLIWGLCPVYWKVLSHVPAIETITHRIVWSFLFLLPVIYFQGNWKVLIRTFRSLKTLGQLSVTTLLVAANWFLFIWAVNNDLILQTSLGYYINPLVNVLFGMLFLKEKLRKFQVLAVFIAGAGVLYLTWQYGAFPWIAVILAVTFGSYGLIRKILDLDPAVGLAVETLILTLPGLIYLFWLEKNGTATFLHVNTFTDIFLIGTALLTALPLLLFNMGARRLRLATLGFLQYLAPSVTFLLAVFVYKEPLSGHQFIAFVFIWTALAVYTADSAREFRGK